MSDPRWDDDPRDRDHGRELNQRSRGGISRRKDGRYCAALVVGRRHDGKLDRRWFYGNTKDDVRRDLNRVIKDRDDGVRSPSRRPRTGAYLRDWHSRFSDTWRPKTALSYQQIVEQHLIPAFEQTPLDKLHHELLHQRGESTSAPRLVLK